LKKKIIEILTILQNNICNVETKVEVHLVKYKG